MHQTIISADCHAGGSHVQYREHLDPAYHQAFDDWRGGYRNPFEDLRDERRFRNWDDEMRNGQQEADGVVAEVVYPNTVPPFFPSFVLFAPPPKPEDYELRLAGVRAHNRWLAEFCGRFPERRAGVGQIFLNDVDDAIEDVRRIADLGLRGGVLLPNIPPDVKWVEPLYSRAYDPLWAEIERLGLPINVHGGTGSPNYGRHDAAQLVFLGEVYFYSQRPLVHLILGGVFERFPGLRFVMAELGCFWVPELLEALDIQVDRIRTTGRTGELRWGEESKLPRLPSEYFEQSCTMAVSQPRPADVTAMHQLGFHKVMWGSDYPHDEGTHPYTREHLRQVFHGIDRDDLTRVLSGTAAEVYGFDLDALAPLAERFGPTAEELAEPLLELPDPPNEALIRGTSTRYSG
ncbi:MAG: amidohydrolase [Acidimicrobiales bacterium]|nr:amidohydrolase [Acidimicrobiales bacterium]